MSIQWFHGYMNAAKEAIKELLPYVDIVIELLDARAPFSSCNPLLQYLIKHKTTIKLLNKSDLADTKTTKMWLDFFEQQENAIAITGQKDDLKFPNKIIALCRELKPHRKSFEKPLRVMITGIPNVGKSTLINKLINKKSAKTGDIPAVTKSIQCLTLEDNFLVYDTPGMMWQKIKYDYIGNNLAICNSIGRRALDEETLALYLVDYLKINHIDLLCTRYKISPHDLLSLNNNMDIIHIISKKRGCLLPGGISDIQKTSELIIQDFRDGRIGKISMETPHMWDMWMQEERDKTE